jgi:hypothetical protein
MIKTTLKVVVALIVINACFRSALVAWDYYELRDEAQQLLQFGAAQTETTLHNAILMKAAELEVPLRSEGLVVRRAGARTTAEASYTQPVEWFPNQFYPVKWSFAVEALSVGVIPAPGR